MAETTPRHGLPLLQAGQAQKEITHNEALMLLDLLAHPAVEEGPRAEPPASPTPGQVWVVGNGAGGAWAGRDNSLALWTEGGWRFAPARTGLIAWIKTDNVFAHFDGTDWRPGSWPVASLTVGGVQVVGAQGSAISDPAGGTTVDAEAREAISSLLAVLRGHGLIVA